MSLCAASADTFRCPTKWELWEHTIALQRPGRAQQAHQDVIEIAAPDDEIWPPDNPYSAHLTVMQQFWAAFAEVLEYLHQRACALLPEFFCSTANETLDQWAVEYGYPDPCEPYDSLCEKVVDVPGARCADIVATALRRGWVIECSDCGVGPYMYGVADLAVADCAIAECGCDGGVNILVRADLSPAYEPNRFAPIADISPADCSDLCGVNLDSLLCLLERIRPAHLPTRYSVRYPRTFTDEFADVFA